MLDRGWGLSEPEWTGVFGCWRGPRGCVNILMGSADLRVLRLEGGLMGVMTAGAQRWGNCCLVLQLHIHCITDRYRGE